MSCRSWIKLEWYPGKVVSKRSLEQRRCAWSTSFLTCNTLRRPFHTTENHLNSVFPVGRPVNGQSCMYDSMRCTQIPTYTDLHVRRTRLMRYLQTSWRRFWCRSLKMCFGMSIKSFVRIPTGYSIIVLGTVIPIRTRTITLRGSNDWHASASSEQKCTIQLFHGRRSRYQQ
jgi:hypothetical protein